MRGAAPRAIVQQMSCVRGCSCGSINGLYYICGDETRASDGVLCRAGAGDRLSLYGQNLVHGFEATGTVRNLPDGRVELVAEGARAELEGLLEAVRQSDVGRFIRREQMDWAEAINEFRSFEITQ